jgi:dTDP-4-amino-4,6-dideoxygalactose transaminase
MRKIPFSPPDISELEIQEVCEALRSGWITTGPRTKKLEQKLAQYCHTDKMVCLNSATAAEELNLRVLGIGPGDEVLVPAYTYTASASAAIHTGATVRFIDCQENSLEMDYDRMEAAITEKTKAVIPVDLGGIPCDYDRIYEAVERKKDLFRPNSEIQKAMGRIAVVADCAHALGAEKNGKMTGALADFSSFSFHAVKNFTTAEGGASCWKTIPGVDNDELYHQYQLLSLHGQSKDALAKTKLGAWEYDIVGPWYKCNMTDIMAAIGLKQLERYPGLLQRRAEIIRRYDAALQPLGVETLTHFGEDYRSSGHLYITRVPNITEQQRNDIIVKMAEREIACNVHYKPLPMMTAYKTLGFDIEDYPNAYKHYANEITLPLHTKLSDEDVAYVIENFTEILEEYL